MLYSTVINVVHMSPQLSHKDNILSTLNLAVHHKHDSFLFDEIFLQFEQVFHNSQ